MFDSLAKILNYSLLMLFLLQTSIAPAEEAAKGAPDPTPAPTADKALQMPKAPVVLDDRQKVQNSQPTVDPLAGKKQQQLGKGTHNANKLIAEDPTIAEDSLLKYNGKKEQIQQQCNKEQDRFKNASTIQISQAEKDAFIQGSQAECDEKIGALKEEYARDMGYENYKALERDGRPDPDSINLKESRGKVKGYKALIDPSSYLSYLTLLALAFLAPALTGGCTLVANCVGLDKYGFIGAMALYLAGEIAYFAMYKNASSKILEIDKAGQFDQQIDKLKKAEKVYDKLLKAIKLKKILLGVASGLIVITLAATLLTMAIYDGDPTKWTCLAFDYVCAPVAAADTGVVFHSPDSNYQKIKNPYKDPFKDRVQNIYDKKTMAHVNWEKSNQNLIYLKMREKTFFEIKNAENATEAFLEYLKWGEYKDQTVSRPERKALVTKVMRSPAVKEMLLEFRDKSALETVKNALIVSIEQTDDNKVIKTIQNNFKNSHNIRQKSPLAFILNELKVFQEAQAADTVGLAVLGIGAVVFLVLSLLIKSYRTVLANAYDKVIFRIVFHSVVGVLITTNIGLVVLSENKVKSRAKKIKKVREEIEALKEKQGELINENFAKDGGIAAARSQGNFSIGKAADYDDDLTECIHLGKKGKSINEIKTSTTDCPAPPPPGAKIIDTTTQQFENAGAALTFGSAFGKDAGKVRKAIQNKDAKGAETIGASALQRDGIRIRKAEKELKKRAVEALKKKDKDFNKIQEKFGRKAVGLAERAVAKAGPGAKEEVQNFFTGSLSPAGEDAKEEIFLNDSGIKQAVGDASLSDLGLSGLVPKTTDEKAESGFLDELDEKEDIGLNDTDPLGADEYYEYNNSEDIRPNDGTSIFKVLSNRYKKTALRNLLDKQVKQ